MSPDMSFLEKAAVRLRSVLSKSHEVVVSRGQFPTSRPHLVVYKRGLLFRRRVAELYPEYEPRGFWVDFDDPVEIIMKAAQSLAS